MVALARPNNSRGFTLVEVLVSMLILAIGLIGSLIGMMAAFDQNLGNTLRNEAVKIAQEQAEAARNMDYSLIQAIPASQTVWRQARKRLVKFTLNTARTSPTAGGYTYGMTKLTITVSWDQKKESHSYVLETIVRELEKS
jgi:prepilin-type N-terminal cleavage/methylation domain-containing protein